MKITYFFAVPMNFGNGSKVTYASSEYKYLIVKALGYLSFNLYYINLSYNKK